MMLEKSKFSEKRTVHTTNKFKGINHSPAACDGDIYSAKNISCSYLPAIGRAKNRYTALQMESADAYSTLGADSALFYSGGTDFVYDGQLKGTLASGRKNFAALGNTVFIFPDKKYYSHGTVAYRYAIQKMLPCSDEFQTGVTVELVGIGDEPPSSANEGDLFYLDGTSYLYKYTSGAWQHFGSPDPLVRYTVKADKFKSMDATHTWNAPEYGFFELKSVGDDGNDGDSNLKFTFYKDADTLSARNFGDLKVGDIISVSGVILQNSLYPDLAEKLAEGTVITDIGTSYITVKNTIGITNVFNRQHAAYKKVIFKRIVPNLSCIARVGDRLWGAYKNKIYACASADPLKWWCAYDLSDAIMIRPDISEDIIGCADLGGLPVFFTESNIIKVLKVYNGYKPSITPAPSLSSKCPLSLAYASGDLFYAANDGIMRYSGSALKKVECNLPIKFTDLVGGSDGINYYLSDSANTYIYHPDSDSWSMESGGFLSFARHGADIYGINIMYSSYFVSLIGKNTDEVSADISESEYSPGATQIYFAPFYEGTHEKKTFTKLFLTTDTSSSTTVSVYTSFDGKPYELAYTLHGKDGINRTEIPLLPNRADYMKIYLLADGGEFRLLSLSREFISHSGNNY